MTAPGFKYPMISTGDLGNRNSSAGLGVSMLISYLETYSAMIQRARFQDGRLWTQGKPKPETVL